jgi:hypothetical protein
MVCTYTHGRDSRCPNCGAYTYGWYRTGETDTTGRNYYTFTTPPLLPPLPAIPKSWRWWHALAKDTPAPVLRLLDGFQEAMRRVQERHPASQRLRWKRRRFLHQMQSA